MYGPIAKKGLSGLPGPRHQHRHSMPALPEVAKVTAATSLCLPEANVPSSRGERVRAPISSPRSSEGRYARLSVFTSERGSVMFDRAYGLTEAQSRVRISRPGSGKQFLTANENPARSQPTERRPAC